MSGELEKARKKIRQLEKRILEYKKIETFNVNAIRDLKKSEARYRTVLENQTDLIARFIPGCILVLVNEAYCRYFKMTREELLGRSFLPRITKKRQQMVLKKLSAITPEHPLVTYDMKVDSPRRGVIWQNWINRGIFDKSGELIEYQSVGRDITERKKMEEALKSSKKRYQAVVEVLDELVFRYLFDHKLTFVNQAFCSFWKKKPKELLGRSFFTLLSEPVQKLLNTKLSNIKRGNRYFSIEIQFKSPSGEICWQQWTTRGLLNDSGKVSEFQTVAKDITELKNKEIALKDSEKLLKVQKKNLEQKNIALKEILHQIDSEKNQLKENITLNIDNFIMPIVKKIRSEQNATRDKYIDLLENNLLDMISPFGRNISEQHPRLTRREIEICNMIRNGLTSKEIAKLLYISYHTVENHRVNIRKKLNIQNRKANLATFIQNIP